MNDHKIHGSFDHQGVKAAKEYILFIRMLSDRKKNFLRCLGI